MSLNSQIKDIRLCHVLTADITNVLKWDGFEYADEGTDNADPLSGGYFICPNCQRLIEKKHKTGLLDSIEWRATVKPKNPGHVGFQLSRFYSPWVRWQDIALNYEAAKHDPQQLQVFWNASLEAYVEYILFKLIIVKTAIVN